MSGNDKKRQIHSTLKITLNAIITLAVACAFMLIGIFAIDKFEIGKDNSLTYWLQKGLTAMATFTLMITTANITEEARKKKDKALNDRVSALDNHYKTIMENGETDDLEKLLTSFNKKNKYEAYIKKYKTKYKFLLNHKPKKDNEKYNQRKLALEEKLLVSPTEVWEDEYKIKYTKITYSQMVSGEFDVSSEEDDFDVQVHKSKYAIKKMLWKIVSVVAFGGMVADFVFSFSDFNKGMILSLILKLATCLISAYSGVCFGYFIVDRIKTVLKRKLRIFSQFRSRQDNTALVGDEKWLVPIKDDILIAKIRKQHDLTSCSEFCKGVDVKVEEVIENDPKSLKTPHNALEKTWQETFGNDKPVKVGGFIGEVLKNSLEIDAQKNINKIKETA